jgi:hypothetical protein
MITCERCNTENLDGSQYCDECGALLEGGASRPRRPITGPTENGDGALVMRAADAETSGDSSPQPRSSGAPLVAADNGHSEGSQVKAASASASASSSSSSIRSASAAEAAFPSGPHAKLVIHRGRSAGKEFPMNDDEIHIGRWDADGGIFPDVDLDADDPEAKVSRRHARITRRGEQYFVEDLGSTNGTFINRGRRLLPGDRQPLRDGDEVIVGKTFLRFQVIK